MPSPSSANLSMALANGRPPVKRENIAQAIRAWILDQRFQPGDRIPPYLELQKIFAVSSATLRSVMAVLQEEGVVQSLGRRGLAVAAHPPILGRVACVFFGDSEGKWSLFHIALRKALTELQSKRNLEIFFINGTSHTCPDMHRLTMMVERRQLQGLFFGMGPYHFIGTSLLADDDLPRVAYMADSMPGVSAVYTDYDAFYLQAFRMLREQGCRSAGLLMLPNAPVEDLDRIIAAGLSAGIAIRMSWIQSVTPEHARWARNAVHLLFDPDGNRPDSLIITDDHLVTEGLEGLRELGYGEENRLPVVAFGNKGAIPPTPLPVHFIVLNPSVLIADAFRILDESRNTKVISCVTIQPEIL